MDSPYVPAGPETAPTSQTSQPVISPTSGPQPSIGLNSTGLSPASTASIAVFLSLFGLAAIAFAICWTRGRRTTSKVSDERPSDKSVVHDIEALTTSHPIVPVPPRPDVRWTPQIRSISGPALDQGSNRNSAALYPRRARSPPPLIKTRNQFLDPYAKSAPAHALSFSCIETLRPPRSLENDLSPPVSPQALAVSGMQTRSLGRLGSVSEN